MKAGLTSREVVFEEWDPDEVGEGVSGEDDEHDQQNLAPMQMSTSEIFCYELRCFHCLKEGHRQQKRKYFCTMTRYFYCSSFSLWIFCGYQFPQSCCSLFEHLDV